MGGSGSGIGFSVEPKGTYSEIVPVHEVGTMSFCSAHLVLCPIDLCDA